MNALREGWDALGCHVVFFLLPDNYRFLTIIADHLADWMPLKLRFPIQDDRRSHIRRHGRSPGFAGDFMSPVAAKQTLATLEILLKEALEKGMDRKRLVARFYLPMFEAALILGHFGKADRLRHHIPETDVPQSDRLNWRRYNAALDAHYSHGRSSS
jgi:hypothetical protein